VLEPVRRELSEYKFDGVNKGRLEVTKGEGSQMGVSTNLGTKVNRRKRAIRLDPNVMENVSAEWGDKGDRVVIKVNDARKRVEEVLFDKLFLRYPKFLAAVVDGGVLIGVLVDSESTGRSVEEIGEEISYRYF